MKKSTKLSDWLFNSAEAHAQQTQSISKAPITRVLSDSSDDATSAFKLKDASVLGQPILVSEPRDWHQMELEHISARTFDAAK